MYPVEDNQKPDSELVHEFPSQQEVQEQADEYIKACFQEGYEVVDRELINHFKAYRCCWICTYPSEPFIPKEEQVAKYIESELEDIFLPQLGQYGLDKIAKRARDLGISFELSHNVLTVMADPAVIQVLKSYISDVEDVSGRAWYPKHWDFKDTRPYSETKVATDSAEYHEILQMLHETESKINVVAVTRIQNYPLMQMYISSMAATQQATCDRKLLFHGTRKTRPGEIYGQMKKGLSMDFARSESNYGKGIYFSQDASVPCSGYYHPLSNGNHQVLIADVFTGREYPYSYVKEIPNGFDSLFIPQLRFYVLHRDYHSYPLYLVEYNRKMVSVAQPSYQPFMSKIITNPPLMAVPTVPKTTNVQTNCSAYKIIRRELYIVKNELDLSDIEVDMVTKNDITEWIVSINGPCDTCYEGGLFTLRVSFDEDYPMKRPVIKFETPIYHPCIKGEKISMHILENWTPAIDMRQVLVNLLALLHNPLMEDPLEPEIARLCELNMPEFKRKAADWTARCSF